MYLWFSKSITLPSCATNAGTSDWGKVGSYMDIKVEVVIWMNYLKHVLGIELRVITIKNLNNNVMCHRILSGSDAYKARFGFEMDLR